MIKGQGIISTLYKGISPLELFWRQIEKYIYFFYFSLVKLSNSYSSSGKQKWEKPNLPHREKIIYED